MQIFINLIYLTFFLIYIVNSIPIAINSNIYNKINLNKDITEIFLKAENYHYITVEIFFSHASRYYISFNFACAICIYSSERSCNCKSISSLVCSLNAINPLILF